MRRELAATIVGSREVAWVTVTSSVIGAAAGASLTGATLRGVVQGALSGALISVAVRLGNVGVGELGASRRPFGIYVAVTAVVTTVAILAGLVLASLPWLFTEGVGGWRRYFVPFLTAVAASIGFTWWFALDRLLGGGVLVGLLTGRYHRPRLEARVFLFADLWESTSIAEHLGELRYHAFLNRVFGDAGRPVARHAGLIYQYVGDEIVVTWPLEDGLQEWRCLRCALAISETLRAADGDYERDYGVKPRFRFAVHSGVVVAGEVGDLRREIVFSGDTMNTAARIEALAKETGRKLVASEAVLAGRELPPDLAAESLGRHRLRGKQQPLELFAVERL